MGIETEGVGDEIARDADKIRVGIDGHLDGVFDQRNGYIVRGMEVGEVDQTYRISELGNRTGALSPLEPGRLDQASIESCRSNQEGREKETSTRSAFHNRVLLVYTNREGFGNIELGEFRPGLLATERYNETGDPFANT